LDLITASARLMSNVIGAMAEFERALYSGKGKGWHSQRSRQGEAHRPTT
jgi:hypothetical protein